jgi:hypothetical protein
MNMRLFEEETNREDDISIGGSEKLLVEGSAVAARMVATSLLCSCLQDERVGPRCSI